MNLILPLMRLQVMLSQLLCLQLLPLALRKPSIWLVLRLPLSPATPFCACSWALLSSRSA